MPRRRRSSLPSSVHSARGRVRSTYSWPPRRRPAADPGPSLVHAAAADTTEGGDPVSAGSPARGPVHAAGGAVDEPTIVTRDRSLPRRRTGGLAWATHAEHPAGPRRSEVRRRAEGSDAAPLHGLVSAQPVEARRMGLVNRRRAGRRVADRGPSTRCRSSSAFSPRSTYGRPGPDDRRHDHGARHAGDGASDDRLDHLRRCLSQLWLLAGLRSVGRVRITASAHRTRRSSGALPPRGCGRGAEPVGWWVIAPVIWDDGWVVARRANVFGARQVLDRTTTCSGPTFHSIIGSSGSTTGSPSGRAIVLVAPRARLVVLRCHVDALPVGASPE